MYIQKYVSKNTLRTIDSLKDFFANNPKAKLLLIGFTVLISVFVISKMTEHKNVIYRGSSDPSFENGRILGEQTSSYLKSKELQLSNLSREVMDSNKKLEEKIQLLEKRMEAKS